MYKTKWVKYFVVCVIFASLGLAYSREMPVLKRWIFAQIKKIVLDKAAIQISAQQLNFTLFPPGIEFSKINFKTTDPALAKTLSPVSVELLGIRLSPIAALAGRFEIGEILLQGLNVTIKVRENKSPQAPAQTHFAIPWADIIRIPVRALTLDGAQIQGELASEGLFFKTEKFGLRIKKSSSAIQSEIFSPHLFLKRKGDADKIYELGIAARMIFEQEAAELSALKISAADSFLIARGLVRGPVMNLKFHSAGVRAIAHLKLPPLIQELRAIFPQIQIPDAQGQLNFELTGTQKKNSLPSGQIQIDGQNLSVSAFKIGQVSGLLQLDKGVVTSKKVEITNTAGMIRAKDVTFNLADENKFSARLQAEKLELEKFLENIDVGRPPLHLEIDLKAACEGRLKPEVRMSCAGNAEGKNFRVFTEPENKNIVALKEFHLLTRFDMNKDRMIFPEGELRVGSSSGKASGVIDFKEGFTFGYNSSALDFKDIQSLADLKYDGKIEISGITKGDGHAAIFNSHIKMNDFWLEDYGFGHGEFDLSYETSQLNFKNINAGYKNTDYKGEVSVKVSSPSHIAFNLDLPRLTLEDLTYAFSRKVNLGLDASGQGRAHVEGSGPLALSQLDYKLTSQINNGVVLEENFKNLVFNVHAVAGHAFADEIHVKKGDALITMRGDVSSNGLMSMNVQGDGLHLFDVEYIRNNFKGLDGLMRFDMNLQKDILNPLVYIKGQITQTSLNQDPLEDSVFAIDHEADKSTFDVRAFSEQVRFRMVHPRKPNVLRELYLGANKWDFSSVLSLISGSDFKKDYDTLLTGTLDLKGPHDDFLKGNGGLKVDRLFIKHGTSQMENTRPLEVFFNDGNIQVGNFELKGDSTDLKISGVKDKKDNIKFAAEGSVDLGLFSFLTPFFQDMRGQLKLNAQVAGKSTKPEFLGNAFIQKGYFKLKNFTHAFEDIKSDLLFSQSRVVINSLKGFLAGGELNGAGNVFIKGLRDIPVDVAGDLSRATFNIPEGLTSTGSGRFRITGNWFPYLLRADFNIDSGLYSKNFGEEAASDILKRSTFLPKSILQKETSSLEFDIATHFLKGVTVKNNYVDTEVRGNLRVKGDTQKSIITGDLETLPNGKFYFRETPFAISSAKVKFDNPSEINPQIYAVGTSRVREWDVNLLYQGTLDKHEIKLSSTPPLPERSIVSLLALGTTDDDLEKTRSNSLQALQGYQAGGVLLEQNPLLQDFKRKTGVVVKFTQSVDDTRNIISPHFVAQKDWTPHFSTSLGRTTGSRSSNDFKMEYRLNKNVSVLGSYEQRDYDQFSVSTLPNSASIPVPAGTTPTTTTDIFGIDLQYQLEFR